MRARRLFLPAIILSLILVACNLPGRLTPPSATPSVGPLDLASTPTETVAPAPTQSPSATFTLTSNPPGVLVSVSQETNCRMGPGSRYDRVSILKVSQSAVGRGRSASYDFWIVDNPSGAGTCWVWGFYATLTGDSASLPVMDPPATPTPVEAQGAVNLVGLSLVIDPDPPVCNQPFTVGLTVSNAGTLDTSSAGTVSLLDIRVADNTQQASTLAGFPALSPGDSFFVTIPLTINTWYNEQHKLVLKIDPDDQIPESDKSDNGMEQSYTLQRGSCP